MCYRCFKAKRTCICTDLQAVDHRTGITILQHPRERHHALGTVRIAKLGLKNVDVQIRGPQDAADTSLRDRLPPNTALLYPKAGARDLADLAKQERPDHLLVLDGTWHHAKTLYRANPWMADLPHVKVSSPTPSRYRIRREPSVGCLSTLEAIVCALGILEEDPDASRQLLRTFDRMIDRQIDCQQHQQTPRQRRSSRARRSPMPRWLLAPQTRLVVAYGEFTYDSQRRREFLRWTAVRLGDAQVFDHLMRPERSMPGRLT
ncbi:MAG: tRNA-uridine aminocarboxypropyltransferase [Myxococcota bacterium]